MSTAPIPPKINVPKRKKAASKRWSTHKTRAQKKLRTSQLCNLKLDQPFSYTIEGLSKFHIFKKQQKYRIHWSDGSFGDYAAKEISCGSIHFFWAKTNDELIMVQEKIDNGNELTAEELKLHAMNIQAWNELEKLHAQGLELDFGYDVVQTVVQKYNERRQEGSLRLFDKDDLNWEEEEDPDENRLTPQMDEPNQADLINQNDNGMDLPVGIHLSPRRAEPNPQDGIAQNPDGMDPPEGNRSSPSPDEAVNDDRKLQDPARERQDSGNIVMDQNEDLEAQAHYVDMDFDPVGHEEPGSPGSDEVDDQDHLGAVDPEHRDYPEGPEHVQNPIENHMHPQFDYDRNREGPNDNRLTQQDPTNRNYEAGPENQVPENIIMDRNGGLEAYDHYVDMHFDPVGQVNEQDHFRAEEPEHENHQEGPENFQNPIGHPMDPQFDYDGNREDPHANHLIQQDQANQNYGAGPEHQVTENIVMDQNGDQEAQNHYADMHFDSIGHEEPGSPGSDEVDEAGNPVQIGQGENDQRNPKDLEHQNPLAHHMDPHFDFDGNREDPHANHLIQQDQTNRNYVAAHFFEHLGLYPMQQQIHPEPPNYPPPDLEITPSNQFTFNAPLDVDLVSYLRIFNPSYETILYKIDLKGNCTNRFRIEPSNGELGPREEIRVVVTSVAFYCSKEDQKEILKDNWLRVSWILKASEGQERPKKKIVFMKITYNL